MPSYRPLLSGLMVIAAACGDETPPGVGATALAGSPTNDDVASPTDPCATPTPIIILRATKTRDTGAPTPTEYPFQAATPIPVCIQITRGGTSHGNGSTGAVTLDSDVLLAHRDFERGFSSTTLERSLDAGPHVVGIDLAAIPGVFIEVVVTTPAIVGTPIVIAPDFHDTSPPLRSLTQSAAPLRAVLPEEPEAPPVNLTSPTPDPVLQTTPTPGTSSADFAVINGVDGGSIPPDPNGSIGGSQVVEVVNLAVQVFDKSSGESVFGPIALDTIWQGLGGLCPTAGFGDPIVSYDKAAGRWLIRQMASASGSYEECIAISTTSDASGSYYRYSFPNNALPDYAKAGVWSDAYYVTYNNPLWACAYDRALMLTGGSANAVCFPNPSPGGPRILPADLDGTTAPPSGQPNFLISYTGSTTTLNFYAFHVDFNTPSSSTFTGPTVLSVAAFSTTMSQAPQAGTSQTIDTLEGTMMNRFAYRNFGSHESLVTCQTVDGAGSTGIRWYEIRSPGSTPTVHQQGTYAPDSDYRFACSAAMDGAGNLAVGYSVSGSTVFPSIRFASRFASDPSGLLRAEGRIVEGGGAQSGFSRWGDYTGMAVDPADDMTFAYTNQYYATSGPVGASPNTRIAEFTLNPFASTGNMTAGRFAPTIVLLPTGKVLVAGGGSTPSNALSSAELYDPATGSFTATGTMTAARFGPVGVLLPNGKVLIAGGYDTSQNPVATAELYDPNTGTFTATGSMTAKRVAFTATGLPNGKVLIAGGSSTGTDRLATAELYDLTTGTFAATGSLATARAEFNNTATLLPNGKVLVAGGEGATVGQIFSTAELYDPATGTFSVTGSMSTPRYAFAQTLLPSGKVLIAGGTSNGNNLGALASAELYDPVAGTFSATGSLNTARFFDVSPPLSLPDGNVLVVGGRDSTAAFLTSAELYDLKAGTFGFPGIGTSTTHFGSPIVVLPNAKVLIAGGSAGTGSTDAAELYDSGYPQTVGRFTSRTAMASSRDLFVATQLATGNVLLAGGSNGASALATAELYNPLTNTVTAVGSMTAARVSPSATLLPDGRVLVAGGQTFGGTALASAELYNPSTATFTATGSMATARTGHTATLLPTGKVLIAGGATATAELYDPATGTFSATGSMTASRTGATAVLLSANGKVLIAGGTKNNSFLSSAELYDPWAGTFASTGAMASAHAGSTAVVLPSGKVLIAGGQSSGNTYLNTAELYNPYTGTFSGTGSMSTTRASYAATLLPNGRVLISGGTNGGALGSAELYDAAAGAFVATGPLVSARFFHQATQLRATGRLLTAGGTTGGTWLATAELYQ